MNIYDIAKQAGVSIATVSRVLNGSGRVSEATRKKVEAVLTENNYTPSAIARGMVSKSLRTVAVLTVDIRVPHYARTAYIMEQEFSRRGYEVILCNTGGDREATLKYLRAVTEKQVDGIILVGSVFNEIGRDPEVEALLRTVPVVLANGALDIPNAYSVLVEDAYGVGLAVEHLRKRGCKRLVYVKDRATASAATKAEGFLRAAGDHLADPGCPILETDDSPEGGLRATERLLSSSVLFDGVVCGEDLTAVGVVNGLTRAGLRVPEDVAVTGFNNSVYGKLCTPILTGVDNKPEQVAMESVQLLEALINGEDCRDRKIFPELSVGGSA